MGFRPLASGFRVWGSEFSRRAKSLEKRDLGFRV